MEATREPPPLPLRARSRLTARRLELAQALEDLFLEQGFSHLSLDAIAAELKCGKMTLYTLAPTRDELVRNVFVRFFESVTPVDAVKGFTPTGSNQPIDADGKPIAGKVRLTGDPEDGGDPQRRRGLLGSQ